MKEEAEVAMEEEMIAVIIMIEGGMMIKGGMDMIAMVAMIVITPEAHLQGIRTIAVVDSKRATRS